MCSLQRSTPLRRSRLQLQLSAAARLGVAVVALLTHNRAPSPHHPAPWWARALPLAMQRIGAAGACLSSDSVRSQQRRPARREIRPQIVAIATLGPPRAFPGLPDRARCLVGAGLGWSSAVGRDSAPERTDYLGLPLAADPVKLGRLWPPHHRVRSCGDHASGARFLAIRGSVRPACR